MCHKARQPYAVTRWNWGGVWVLELINFGRLGGGQVLPSIIALRRGRLVKKCYISAGVLAFMACSAFSVASTLIPLSGHHFEHTYDHVRNRLYIPTENGTVERYDIGLQQLLSPISVGNDLRGSDITADGGVLYIADRQRIGDQGFIHKVDLNTYTLASISTPTPEPRRVTSDIAIAANGQAIVTTDSDSSFTRVLALNILNDSWQALDGNGSTFFMPINGQIARSSNRNLLLGVSGGYEGYSAPRYDARSDSFYHLPKISGWSQDGVVAVDRKGSLLAIENKIYQPDATFVHELPNSAFRTGGLVFDPLQDVLYVAERSSDSVIAYDTQTWGEIGRIPVGEDLGVSRILPESNYMSSSDDGRLLFVTTASGVRMLENPFALPEPSSIFLATLTLAAGLLFNFQSTRYEGLVARRQGNPNVTKKRK